MGASEEKESELTIGRSSSKLLNENLPDLLIVCVWVITHDVDTHIAVKLIIITIQFFFSNHFHFLYCTQMCVIVQHNYGVYSNVCVGCPHLRAL